MDETQNKIASMVSNLSFDRKARATKKEKAAYFELKDDLGKVKKKIDKLHLRLWHCEYKNDYHSLSLDEAKLILSEAAVDLNNIISRVNDLKL